MAYLDWGIVFAYLAFMIFDGIRMTKHSGGVDGYFLANRSLPWWAVGLSVMATQMSAITLVGATGQAYSDGMRFVQFYYALPIAMIILCVTVVPFFYRARVFTAYEYLERRFDARTRSMTSFFFLISRGLAAGVVIAAPSVILSIVLGWNEITTIFLIGITTTIYTMIGGVQAVTWTDVKQMVVIFFGLFVCLIVIAGKFPEGVSMTDGLHLAGSLGKLETVNFSFDLSEKYTFWSGTVAALFLFLSYFGCDQTQVQRFLTAKSVAEGRTSLLMSAFLKIPMQFMILLIGIMIFVFYQFVAPPMLFNQAERAKVEKTEKYAAIEREYLAAHEKRREAAVAFVGSDAAAAREEYLAADKSFNAARKGAVDHLKTETKSGSYNDVNYVFPVFVLENMPIGVIGLIIAAIFAAAMSTVSAELNALATATTIDFYRRHFAPNAAEAKYVRFGRIATLFWGIFACLVATQATSLGSLIEVVNKFGSFFYGSLLGVFVLAFGFRRANATGAFFGLLTGMMTVFIVSLVYFKGDFYYLSIPFLSGSFDTNMLIGLPGFNVLSENPGGKQAIEFLWLNLVGCVTTVIAGLILSFLGKSKNETGEINELTTA